jgi:glucose-6-phosphate 1-dehydrogenase
VSRPADPCTMVVFGAAGDLMRRKLLPALFNLEVHGQLPKQFAVIGISRKELDDEAFRALMEENVRLFSGQRLDEASWTSFRQRLHHCVGEFRDPAAYQALSQKLGTVQQEHGTGPNVLFYLATPPDFFAPIVEQLGQAGLARQDRQSWRRVIIEKPFGSDLDSARKLNAELGEVLAEDQIWRIDHYLGKETVQNILVFRFANGIFEPIWNRRYVDHVQVTAAESIGIEGRGGYYETAGALRDMVQNHLLQLLALVTMEPPVSLQADKVRDERVKVLEAIRTMTPEQVIERAVRGQYGEGFIGGQRTRGYREEPDVAPASNVETFVALKLYVENWRWAGVPFYVRTGKRLAMRNTEVVIQFRRPPLLFFPESAAGQIEANRLVLHIQPDEGMTLEIKAKRPGTTLRLDDVRLDFSYADFGPQDPATGYERLLYDAMTGDSTLFARKDMVEAAWRVIDPILDVWRSLPPRDFPNHAAGTWGPAAADQLLARDGRQWRTPPARALA